MTRLRIVRTALTGILGLGLLASGAWVAAAEIAVIVSGAAPVPSMDAALLRDIYLKKIFLDDTGRKFIPVNLPVEHPLRRALSATLFGLNSDELQDYWNQRYFHGVTPPYVLGSQDAVVRFVAKTPGAIGYIAPCFLDASVRQVLRLSVAPQAGLDWSAQCPRASSDKATLRP